jgi:hypothetical protein
MPDILISPRRAKLVVPHALFGVMDTGHTHQADYRLTIIACDDVLVLPEPALFDTSGPPQRTHQFV